MIELDYKKDIELFNQTAKNWAEKIGTGKGGVKNTQIRKFYDKVLELYEKSKKLDNESFKNELLPFVKMLNSKVAYASTRSSGGGKLVNETFVSMMNQCINQIDSKQKLENFKLFFEALLGFHKGEEK